MNKKFPIYIPMDELTSPEYKVELKVNGANSYALNRTTNIKVPAGTLYKINQVLLQNIVCDVYYFKAYRLWYVLLGKKVLWSNFKIATEKPKRIKRAVTKPEFNRYTALTKGR